MTLIVGVTGGIGSGKSTLCNMLAQCDAFIINADEIGKDLVDKNTDIQNNIKNTFGSDFFDSKGSLKRRELGRMVFSNPDALDRLNHIIREPLIHEIENRIESASQSPQNPIIIVDIAILFEAELSSLFDHIVVVTAPTKLRADRLCQSRDWTRKETHDRIDAQLPEEEKVGQAHTVIENNGSIEHLKQEAKNLYDKLQSMT